MADQDRFSIRKSYHRAVHTPDWKEHAVKLSNAGLQMFHNVEDYDGIYLVFEDEEEAYNLRTGYTRRSNHTANPQPFNYNMKKGEKDMNVNISLLYPKASPRGSSEHTQRPQRTLRVVLDLSSCISTEQGWGRDGDAVQEACPDFKQSSESPASENSADMSSNIRGSSAPSLPQRSGSGHHTRDLQDELSDFSVVLETLRLTANERHHLQILSSRTEPYVHDEFSMNEDEDQSYSIDL